MSKWGKKHGTLIWINSGPTKWGGEGLYRNIFDNNENYNNYINYNLILVKNTGVDTLAVADTGMTGQYITFDSPRHNFKKISHSTFHPHPKQRNNHFNPDGTTLQNRLTNWSTESAYFLGINKALLSIETFCSHVCQAVFSDKKLIIINKGNGKIMMNGKRYPL